MHHRPRQETSVTFSWWNTRESLMLFGLVMCAGCITMVQVQQPPSTVTFGRAIHFTAADGRDLVVSPGGYRVEAHEAHLRLTPADGQKSLLVQTTPTVHKETVSAPVAMVVTEEGNDDQVHLVLLLPEAKGLEAVGSLSGIQNRGTVMRPMSSRQIRAGLQLFQEAGTAPPPILKVPSPESLPTTAEAEEVVFVGRQVTWSYLAMHYPDSVAQALADVQSRKQSRESLSGLTFSELELNELLKTDWSTEVTRLNAMRSAGVAQSGVTPRGLSLTDQAKLAPSATAPPPPSANAIAPASFRIPIAVRELGSVWAGQQATTVVSVAAPADSYIQARLNLDATNRHFRILHARSYTGEVVNGALVIAQLIPGGQYQEFVPDPANPKGQISKAGFVTILARKGQQIDFTIAFDPIALGMTPVGDNEATLELSQPLSTDVKILSPSNPPPAMWKRSATIRARFEGINFGVTGVLENAALTKFVEGYAPGTLAPVPASLILTNAEQKPWAVTISADPISPRLHMQPFTVVVGPGERKAIPLPIQIDAGALSVSEYRGTVRYAYGNVVRQVPFGVTYYWSHRSWHSGDARTSGGQVGYCKYTWEVSVRSDGSRHIHWSFRNTHLLVEMRMDIRFTLLDRTFNGGTLQAGQKSITAVEKSFTTLPDNFFRDNYVRLLSAPIRVRIRCNES